MIAQSLARNFKDHNIEQQALKDFGSNNNAYICMYIVVQKIYSRKILFLNDFRQHNISIYN